MRVASLIAAALLTGPGALQVSAAPPLPPSPTTKVVLLGTGTPGPDPNRSGPATAIIVNGVPYLVDFGPGVIRRAAAAQQKGIPGLDIRNLRTAFLTHLHSDHTVGLPDLIFSPWTIGRNRPLRLYGPPGLRDMTRHIMAAYAEDIRIRIKDKQQFGVEGYREGITVNVREIDPGVVYRDKNVTVTAFRVRHGDVANAFGYRFQSPDRTIVISGDTSPAQSVVDACNGCDILIHEAYSMATYNRVSPVYQLYRQKHHTSSVEVADIARRARPKLLVLYHRANPGGVGLPDPEEDLLREVKVVYAGPVVSGRDLDVY
jgi:ribonuclease BN (tRNA processing enzyme)